MKTILLPRCSRPGSRRLGMTLVEVMVTTSIFGLAMAGFMAIHLFALRYDQTVKLKLSASNDARRALNQLSRDVRAAGKVRVGNGDNLTFAEVGLGQAQQGNALEIYPEKGSSNNVIRYYCDPNDQLLKRSEQGGEEVILARSVTNALVFASEDGFGSVLSNNFNNRVISMNLYFYQSPDGQAAGQSGFLYDYYQIHSKITRRSLE